MVLGSRVLQVLADGHAAHGDLEQHEIDGLLAFAAQRAFERSLLIPSFAAILGSLAHRPRVACGM